MTAATNSNLFTSRRTFFALIAGGALALTETQLAGCGSARPRPPQHLYVGIDTSGSARKQIADFRSGAFSLMNSLNADRDELSAYRVGHETREFMGGAVSGDSEILAKTLRAETQPVEEEVGTLPENFWRGVTEDVESNHGTSAPEVDVTLFTDGFNDDLREQSWRNMNEYARRLARKRNVRSVVICGAQPETWERLRRTFRPLGKRFYLLSPTQCQPETVSRLFASR